MSFYDVVILEIFKTIVKKKIAHADDFLFLAGAEGIEPSTFGFGDRRSTNWAMLLAWDNLN